MGISIRLLEAQDINVISAAFTAIGHNKPPEQYARYLADQQKGERVVLVAQFGGKFAGYGTIQWRSGYPPFAEQCVPEITDLNVLPLFRRRRIATRIMDEAERRIFERSPVIGIGVGMYPDYGPAQRMYALRGYVPDGRGLHYNHHPVVPGKEVLVDDDLVLFLTRDLRK